MDTLGPYVIVRTHDPDARGWERFVARRVFDDDIGGPVDVNLVRADSSDFPMLRTLFRDESSFRTALLSATVVQTVGIFDVDEGLIEVSERPGGISLAEILIRFQAAATHPPLAFGLAVLERFFDALSTVHEKNGALGALSLDDVHLTYDGRVRFGRLLVGDDAFKPPESSRRAADDVADVWLAGRLLRVLLAGSASTNVKPRVPSAHSAPVKELLLSMLASRRRARPTLTEARRAVHDILAALDDRPVQNLIAHALQPLQEALDDDGPDLAVVKALRQSGLARHAAKRLPRPSTGPSTVVDVDGATSISARRALLSADRTSSSGERGSDDARFDFLDEKSGVDDAWSVAESVFKATTTSVTRRPRTGSGRRSTSRGGAGTNPASSTQADRERSGRRPIDIAADGALHDDAEARKSPPEPSAPSPEKRGNSPGKRGDATHATVTLADLQSPPTDDGLDLHVDDVILSVGHTLSVDTATSSTDVVGAHPPESVKSTHMGVVWASQKSASDDGGVFQSAEEPKHAPVIDDDRTSILELGDSGAVAPTFGSATHDDRNAAGDADGPAESTILVENSMVAHAVAGRSAGRHAQPRRGKDRSSVDGGVDEGTPLSNRMRGAPRVDHRSPRSKPSIIVADHDDPSSSNSDNDDKTQMLDHHVVQKATAPPSDAERTMMVDDVQKNLVVRVSPPASPSVFASDADEMGSSPFTAARHPPMTIAGEFGTMNIDVPPKAEVYVDGKLVGRGRRRIDGVDRFRMHNVRVLLGGFRPWVAEVSLGGQVSLDVKPELLKR